MKAVSKITTAEEAETDDNQVRVCYRSGDFAHCLHNVHTCQIVLDKVY